MGWQDTERGQTGMATMMKGFKQREDVQGHGRSDGKCAGNQMNWEMEVWQDQWTGGRRKILGGKKNKNEVINVCLVNKIRWELQAI